MGGCADNLLSSHLKEDRTYHEKRRELKKLMPDLGKRLEQMKSTGEQSSPVYAVLSEFRRQVVHGDAGHSRVPLHVLLRGEDLLRREVPELRSKETTNTIIEAVWRCSGFRAAVAKKIRDASAQAVSTAAAAAGAASPPASGEPARIEERLFLRARTKDEYLESAARAILSIRARAVLAAKKRELAARVASLSEVSASATCLAEINGGGRGDEGNDGGNRKRSASDSSLDCACADEDEVRPAGGKVPKMEEIHS